MFKQQWSVDLQDTFIVLIDKKDYCCVSLNIALIVTANLNYITMLQVFAENVFHISNVIKINIGIFYLH